MITQAFIENELIRSQKRITRAEKQQMWLDNRHYRNTFFLESCDGNYTYRVFLRYSDDFIEDFSVGLIWTNPARHINVTKQVILLRCQGPHDSGEPLGADIHHSYHIHETTVQDILERRYSKPQYKEATDKFTSFQSACFILSPDVV